MANHSINKTIVLDELITNPIKGSKDKLNKSIAEKVLKDAKKIEKQQIKAGAVWMIKEKTTKLVLSRNFNKAYLEGFRLVIKNKNIKK